MCSLHLLPLSYSHILFLWPSHYFLLDFPTYRVSYTPVYPKVLNYLTYYPSSPDSQCEACCPISPLQYMTGHIISFPSSWHTERTRCTHPHSVQPLQVLLPVFNNLVARKNTLVFLRLGFLIVHHHLHTQLLPLQLRTEQNWYTNKNDKTHHKKPTTTPNYLLMLKEMGLTNKKTFTKCVILWDWQCVSVYLDQCIIIFYVSVPYSSVPTFQRNILCQSSRWLIWVHVNAEMVRKNRLWWVYKQANHSNKRGKWITCAHSISREYNVGKLTSNNSRL
jgi:hypothetical protein